MKRSLFHALLILVCAGVPGLAGPEAEATVGGSTAPDGTPVSVSPEADRAVRSGTGGLY